MIKLAMYAFVIVASSVFALVFLFIPWVERKEKHQRADRRGRWRNKSGPQTDGCDDKDADGESTPSAR